MLPYTPLHHLLLVEIGGPVVATSGNLSDEPICTDEREALTRLAGIADLFLVHNRPIARHVDDSIMRVAAGREQVLRRARGFAPLPIQVPKPMSPLPAVLAVGAQLKNTVAIAVGRQVFVSQHIGDLETAQAGEAFERVIVSLGELYDFHPVSVACDAHPDYLSTRFARGMGLPVVTVQHHAAHVLGCMAENETPAPALGVSWDGTGLGDDGTIWGGEFLRVTESEVERVAHLRTFMLPGGERAIREPRRAALGLLYEMLGEKCFDAEGAAIQQNQAVRAVWDAFEARELGPLRKMLAGGINCPRTSSAGRLFDAAAALVGLSREMAFEGQAAMALEFALDGYEGGEDEKGKHQAQHYDFAIAGGQERALCLPFVVDWAPMMGQLIKDVQAKIPVGRISRKFHNTLTEMIVAVARRIGESRVVLTGGCFQNKVLLERTVERLRAEGFQPAWHQRIPPNDGGIALGQAVAAARRKE
jgi:hydrogenase maturation protein HypF